MWNYWIYDLIEVGNNHMVANWYVNKLGGWVNLNYINRIYNDKVWS